MKTRRIGRLEVAVVGLGTNNFGSSMSADEVGSVVAAAMEEGINLFDTSDSYGESEERLARALGSRRDEVVIATKFGDPVGGEKGTGGASPDYVRRALEASLRRLATDRIDLYQIHRPDPQTPIGDTMAALDEAVRAGKVREIGCSNFSATQLREAHIAAGAGVRLVSVQNHYNMFHRARRSRGASPLPRARSCVPPVLPACERVADWKVSPRRSSSRRYPVATLG